jgi:hypothetical protein
LLEIRKHAPDICEILQYEEIPQHIDPERVGRYLIHAIACLKGRINEILGMVPNWIEKEILEKTKIGRSLLEPIKNVQEEEPDNLFWYTLRRVED